MYVHVWSGLTSRCITLAHAYHLLKKIWGHKRLVIIWPIDDDCHIHFWEVFDRDIFDDIELKIIELEYSESGGILVNIRKRHFVNAVKVAIIKSKRILSNPNLIVTYFIVTNSILRLIVFGKNCYDYAPPKEIGWQNVKRYEHFQNTWEQVQTALSGSREIYVHAHRGIIMDEEQEKVDFSVIKFRKEYWEQVEEIMIPEEKYIGIHLRRTDHKVAIKESGTEVFIQKIDEIIEKQEDAKFFLATDDISEEEKLKKLYGDRIIVQENKKWGRKSSSEMKSGIVDCLCLSCCEYILGSYTSAFSFFSAKYGKKELIICRDENT